MKIKKNIVIGIIIVKLMVKKNKQTNNSKMNKFVFECRWMLLNVKSKGENIANSC